MINDSIKILCVDDNYDNLITLKALTEEAFPNADVILTMSGQEAVELTASELPDVVLLDVVMPGMDGFEVCRQLKANVALSAIPVVFVTALKGDRESRVKGLEVGAEAFLTKPVDPSELVAQIRSMVKIRKASLEKQDENKRLAEQVANQTRELKATHRATLNLLEDLRLEIESHKETEKALRESEEKYRLLIQNSPNGIAVHQDGKFVFVNKTALKIIGAKTESDLIGKPALSIMHPDSMPAAIERMTKVLSGQDVPAMEEKLIRLDGSIFEAEVIALSSVFDGRAASQVIVTDISERKKAERERRESEARFRLITEQSPIAIEIYDANGKLQNMNQACRELFGVVDENEVLKFDLFADPNVPEEKRDALKNGKSVDYQSVFDFGLVKKSQFYQTTKDGKLQLEVFITPYRKDNGEIDGYLVQIHDITERYEAQKALQESELRFREMAELLPQVVFETDLKGSITFINRFAYELTGYKVDDEILGRNITDFFDRENVGKLKENFNNKLNGSSLNGTRYLLLRKNGGKVPVLIYSSIISRDGEVQGLRGMMADISEQEKANQKILHITRLYAFLSQVNQSIIQSKTREELYESVCRVAIEYGQFRMCWIGRHDETGNKLIPAFHAGYNKGYLEKIDFDLNYPNKLQGPTFKAFETGNIMFCNDIANDPRMKIWRDEALKRNFRSSCAVPLFFRNKKIGTFTLYATEVNFFREDERKLLHEIAENLSFAINAIESEQERKMAEEALRESEERYNSFVNNNTDCIFVKDENLKYLVVNNAMAEFFNKVKEDILFHTDNELTDKSIILPCVSSDHKAIKSKKPLLFEEKLGEKIYETIKFPVHLKNDKTGVGGIMRDITARKQAEEELKNKQMELKAIYDNAPVMLCVIDQNRSIQFANNAFSGLIGATEEEIRGGILGGVVGCVNSLHDPRGCGYGPNCVNCSLRLAIDKTFRTGQGVQNIEYQSVLSLGGSKKSVSMLGSTAIIESNQQKSVLLSLHDISARKSAEEALQKSESLLRSFIDNSPFEIWARDIDSIGILENKKFVENYGSIIGVAPREDTRVTIEMVESWERINKDVFAGQTVEEEFDFYIKGELRRFRQIVFPIRNNDQKIIGIAGFNIDISDAKRAEEELLASNSRFELAARIANMAWWEIHLKTDEVYFSRNKTEMIGYQSEMFTRYHHFLELVHPDDLAECLSSMQMLLDGTADKYEVEYRMKTYDETYKWFYDIGSVSGYDKDGVPTTVSGLAMDITQRKLAMQALDESQAEIKKFAAHLQDVREDERLNLAREIHDELGQILVAIKIDLGMLRMQVLKHVEQPFYEETYNKFQDLVTLVDNTLKSARRIMSDLRPEVLDMVGLTEAIRQHLKSFAERYHIEAVFNNSVHTIQLNTQQSVALYRIVQEALNNIAKHAQASRVVVKLQQQNGLYLLSVKDDGVGFEVTNVRKMNSYGLIGMKERVVLLDGDFRILSKPGEGTEVQVKFQPDIKK